MNIVVRDIVPEDAEALGRIIVTATQTAFVGLVPDICLSWLTESERAALSAQALADGTDPGKVLARADETRSAENWRRSLAQGPDPGEVRLVAEHGGAVVGYAMGGICAEDSPYRGELTQLYVLPAQQGRGVGRALVCSVASRLAQQGVHNLRVGVLRVNPNRRFYERLGAQYLYDRDFNWGGIIQPECVYGWKDTRGLRTDAPGQLPAGNTPGAVG